MADLAQGDFKKFMAAALSPVDVDVFQIGRLTAEMWSNLPRPCQVALAGVVDGVLEYWEEELKKGLH